MYVATGGSMIVAIHTDGSVLVEPSDAELEKKLSEPNKQPASPNTAL